MARRRLSPQALVAVACLLVAAVVAVALLAGDGEDEGAGASSNNGLPDPAEVGQIELSPLGDGRTGGPEPPGDLDDVLGDKPVVVNFFASWCQPCIEEMPAFEIVHQDMADAVTFLGLATSDGDDRALQVVERTGVTYPTFGDQDGEAFELFRAVNMPATVFISPDGDVMEVHNGPLTEDELRRKISEHFWS